MSSTRPAALLLVVAVLSFGAAIAGTSEVVAPARADADAPFDWSNLNPNAKAVWGVNGTGGTQLSRPIPEVWAFAETAGRLYVGGTFQTASDDFPERPTATVVNQRYLAAFDIDTGVYIDSFTPTFDYAVHALAVAPNGALIVGGEFTTVNGQPREALVALDPITGAIDPTFANDLQRQWHPDRAVAREIMVDGSDLVIVGDFDHVVQNGVPLRVWSAARLDGATGQLDITWLPRLNGSSGWDVDIDYSRGQIHLAGNFYGIDNQTGTARFGTVDYTTGEVIAGHTPFQTNTNGQRDTTSVIYANDRIYVGGAQHIVQVLDADTHVRLGYMLTGTTSTNFSPAGYVGGGDVQTMERIGDTIVQAGHFNGNQYRQNPPDPNYEAHYSTFDDAAGGNGWSNRRHVAAYDATTSQTIDGFNPNLLQRRYFGWALHADANGCLYIGGDYRQTMTGLYTGGFGKFCPNVLPDDQPPTTPANVTATSDETSVTLTWDKATDNQHVGGYLVHDNWNYVTFLDGAHKLSYVHEDLIPGSSHRYQVRAQDTAGNNSAPSPSTIVIVGAAGPDEEPPTTPTNVSATSAADSVTLRWDAATDNVAVAGYLIHDNWSYVAFVTGAASTSYTHENLGVLSTHRYQIRAQDSSSNNSAPSPITSVTVGGGPPDMQPPTTPQNVSAEAIASGISLSWDPSTDDRGVRGYLVHDNWAFVAFVTGPDSTAFDHTGLTPGERHRYQIRAQDAAGNNSNPSTILGVDF